MDSAALDVYVGSFLARCRAARPAGGAMLDEPGIHGLLPHRGDGRARLLVTDDRARDRLDSMAGDVRAGMITVCARAAQISAARSLEEHLRSLPSAFALWVAVDPGGVVRATSGSAAFGAAASVIFINTDPDWRRRGIARAMTAIALRAAERAGAHQAGLDASSAGRALYLTLGFEAATPITRFRSSATASSYGLHAGAALARSRSFEADGSHPRQ